MRSKLLAFAGPVVAACAATEPVTTDAGAVDASGAADAADGAAPRVDAGRADVQTAPACPAPGSPCTKDLYDCVSDTASSATCVDGHFCLRERQLPIGNPGECPEDLPVAGTPCSTTRSFNCYYSCSCDGVDVNYAQCLFGLWCTQQSPRNSSCHLQTGAPIGSCDAGADG